MTITGLYGLIKSYFILGMSNDEVSCNHLCIYVVHNQVQLENMSLLICLCLFDFFRFVFFLKSSSCVMWNTRNSISVGIVFLWCPATAITLNHKRKQKILHSVIRSTSSVCGRCCFAMSVPAKPDPPQRKDEGVRQHLNMAERGDP